MRNISEDSSWFASEVMIDDGHIRVMGVSAWAVYSVMLRRMGADRSCAISFKELQQVTGFSKGTVNTAIARLVSLGYLIRLHKATGESTVYRIEQR